MEKVRSRQTVFLGVLLLTLPLYAGNAYSQTEPSVTTRRTGQMLQVQIEEAAPFIRIDESGRQQFLTEDANRAKVSIEAIVLAKKLLRIHNRLMSKASNDDPHQGVLMEDKDWSFIEPFFQSVAEGGIELKIGFSDSFGNIAPSATCGNFLTPARCPARVESGRKFATRSQATLALILSGYHKTAGYACNNNENDYSYAFSSNSCGSGTMRAQAIVREDKPGKYWTFWTQSPEPSPEYQSYVWPSTWWVAYVTWWHQVYC